MVVHFLVLAYLAIGGFLAWRWPKMIWPHLAVTGWAVIQLLGLLPCPLTALENWGRSRAGDGGLLPGGFIDTYIEGVIYPDQYIWHVRAVVLLLILFSWGRLIHTVTSRKRPAQPRRT